MAEEVKDFPFEKFPRCSLPFGVARRRVLSALISEVMAYTGKGEGILSYKLADLGLLPDEQLARLVPYIAPGVKISIEDGAVYARLPGKRQPLALFTVDSPAVTVFNQINGYHSIDQAACSLSQVVDWEHARRFAYARGVFLSLVLAGVCLPGNTYQAGSQGHE